MKIKDVSGQRFGRLVAIRFAGVNSKGGATYLGWPKSTIANRLHLGWGIERALSEEPKKRHNQIP